LVYTARCDTMDMKEEYNKTYNENVTSMRVHPTIAALEKQ